MPQNLTAAEPDQTPGSDELCLKSLAPEYDSSHHAVYLNLLVKAIEADGSYNVALTGAYGTGKSSILAGLAKERERRGWKPQGLKPRDWKPMGWGDRGPERNVLKLSLSTISPDAHDPEVPSRTNQIQKEIVKQVLYRLPPRRLPRSSFHRASAPSRRRDWGVAAVSGVVVTLVAVLLGLVHPFMESWVPSGWQQALAYAVLAGAIGAGARGVSHVLQGRPEVSASVTSGPASVTLATEAKSYFDKYLDELVYFFQVSNVNVVVIEDIDRFDDVLVFDTLRALNGLLNHSKQIDRRIVFVYAIRDSVFELIGSAPPAAPPSGPLENAGESAASNDPEKDTLERAGRTKFFDVIIPVIPFVGTGNARDVMSETMESADFAINPALIRLAARHVADMRLIHNIRNEFEVYRNRLVVPDSRVPGIDNDSMFAIVLFKNAHLGDFEKIRYQDSSLDHFYAKWRTLVRDLLVSHTERLARLRESFDLEQTAIARAAHLGRKLTALCAMLANAHSANDASATPDGPATEVNLADVETWTTIASGNPQRILVNDRYGRTLATFMFSADELTELIGESIDISDWGVADLEAIMTEIAEIQERITFLNHHDWKEFCKHPTLASMSPKEGEPSFDDLIKNELKSDLTRDLVRRGYLTEHFGLYTSTYYGKHLGPQALEYSQRSIGPGTPDFAYPLSPNDVKQILLDQKIEEDEDDAELFSDVSMYNINIVDYLLESRPVAARAVALKLSNWQEQERAFLDAYLARDERKPALLAMMAPTWPAAVAYAAVSASVGPAARRDLVDAVLRALPNTDYEISDSVREYIETNYAEIGAITDPGSVRAARVILGFVHRSGAILTSLAPLKREALDLAVDHRMYPVTEANLSELASAGSIALDDLRELDARRTNDDGRELNGRRGFEGRIYTHALKHLANYLEALAVSRSTTYSVVRPEEFEEIIRDAGKVADDSLVGRLIETASEDCFVPDLSAVDTFCAWPFLAAGNRIAPSLTNALAYHGRLGRIDEAFAALLTRHGAITETEGAAEPTRVAIAEMILDAREQIPDPGIRVALAASLKPLVLEAKNIEAESGPLVAHLLRAELLADDAEVFEGHLVVDGPTYVAAIAASQQFTALVTTGGLEVVYFIDVLASDVLSEDIKRAVTTRYLAQIEDLPDGPHTWGQVAEAATALKETRWALSHGELAILKDAHVAATDLIPLIARSVANLTIDELRELLGGLGEKYQMLAEGKKNGRPSFPDDEYHLAILVQLIGVTIKHVTPAVQKVGRRLVAFLESPSP